MVHQRPKRIITFLQLINLRFINTYIAKYNGGCSRRLLPIGMIYLTNRVVGENKFLHRFLKTSGVMSLAENFEI